MTKENQMDTTEAMSVMARAGQAAEARALVDQAVSAAQTAYSEIGSDETRTQEYKSEEMNRVYEEHRARLNAKMTSLAKSAAQAEQRDAAAVFGTADLSGDPASLIISRRDAADRVASLETKQERSALLARANRAGDEVLARAIAEHALEAGDLDTLNAFLDSRPHLDGAAQRLWDAAHKERSGTQKFENAMRLSSLRPPQAVLR